MDISAYIQPLGSISNGGRIPSQWFFISQTFSLIGSDIYALTFSRNGILLQALSGSRRARNGRRPEPVIASMVTSVKPQRKGIFVEVIVRAHGRKYIVFEPMDLEVNKRKNIWSKTNSSILPLSLRHHTVKLKSLSL